MRWRRPWEAAFQVYGICAVDKDTKFFEMLYFLVAVVLTKNAA